MIRDVLNPAVLLFAMLGSSIVVADDPAAGRRAAQESLKGWGGLVGDWRGTGQPQRGSARGSWTESGNWAWKLSAGDAALELKVLRGKFLKSAEIRPGKTQGTYVMVATLADGSSRTFGGSGSPGKPLVLTANEPGDGLRRVTLNLPNEARSLLLLEGRNPDTGSYYRLAEVGYTKQGVAFATSGESGPICIVTEGRGTIPVSYKGMTYYVCCSGCKDLFNEDPAAVLAEYAARQKAKGK